MVKGLLKLDILLELERYLWIDKFLVNYYSVMLKKFVIGITDPRDMKYSA